MKTLATWYSIKDQKVRQFYFGDIDRAVKAMFHLKEKGLACDCRCTNRLKTIRIDRTKPHNFNALVN